MTSTDNCSGTSDAMRRRAEEMLREKVALSPEVGGVLSPDEARLALHELSVHQIELEMQNEEMRRSKAELDASQARYVDLYDFAPVGYLTLNKTGLILEANFSAATLLGVIRGMLVSRPISKYIFKDDQDGYYLFRKQLFETDEPQTCELRMLKIDGSVFWSQMSATVAQNADGEPVCRLMLFDITERKHAEEALLASEIQLQGIIESTAEGLLAVDNEGKVVKANSRFAELWRVPESLLKSHDDNALLSFVLEQLSEPEAFLKKVQLLYKSDATDMDTITFKDGRVFERYSIPFLSGNRVMGRVWSFRDITERIQAEVYRDTSLNVLQILNGSDDLQESIRRVIAFVKTQTGADAVGLRLQDGEDFPYYAQEGFPDNFLLTENFLAARGPDGGTCRDNDGKICLECTCGLVISGKTDPTNPLFTRGGSFWANDSARLLDLPSGQDSRYHPRNECIRLGYASVALIPVRNKDRIIGLLHLTARRKDSFTLAVVKILEDISAHIGTVLMRKQAEAALRESEERFVRLAEQSGTFIWEVDSQGLYTYISPVVEKVLGYHPDELIGRMHFFDLHPESGREAFKASVLSRFQRKEPFADFGNAAQTQDGRALWLITAGQPLLNADGSLRGYRGSDTDITLQKQAETELQNIKTLKSIGVLAGGIAHDFNNILQGLYGNISLAMLDLAETHPSYALLEEAGKSMTRAVRLTKQLLTFAKGGYPVKEAFSLGLLAEEVAHFGLTGSNVSIFYHPAEDLWLVDADRGQISQVISNLVINAREAMPMGGNLHITMENVDLSAEAVLGLSAGRYIKVMVQDTGCGIESRVIAHIFDPYFTTKQTGSGLGLSMVWSIINKHGGHISVVSEQGKGATFTFYLPASASTQSTEAKSPPAVKCPATTRPAKILVVDDEDSINKLVVSMLTPSGYSVVTAPNEQDAIALYKQALEAGAPFDVVILDLTIPGGPGGKKAITDLLELDPNVRAIVSSGYADDPVMSTPTEYGFKGTVAKPYSITALREAVARVLA